MILCPFLIGEAAQTGGVESLCLDGCNGLGIHQPAKRAERGLSLFSQLQGFFQPDLGFHETGVDGQRVLEMGDRFPGVTHLQKHIAQVLMGDRQLRIDADGLAVGGHGERQLI